MIYRANTSRQSKVKQTTRLERCHCRLNRSQRNHIAAAMLVWLSVKELADKTRKNRLSVETRLTIGLSDSTNEKSDYHL